MPTQVEIAEHLDLSQPEVSKWVATVDFDWRAEPMSRVRVEYIRKLRAQAAGHVSSDGQDLVRERVMTERVDRELKELALAEKRGQLVNVSELEPELQRMVAAFRTELLARDDRLRDTLADLYGIDVDLQVLNDDTRNLLIHLAKYEPGRASAGAAPRGGDGAASGDDDDGLGEGVSVPEQEVDGQAGQVQPGPDAVGEGHA